MFDLNLLFQTQSNAPFIPALQTQISTLTEIAPQFTATSTLIIWRAKTGNHLMRCIGVVAIPSTPVGGYVYCPDSRKWVLFAEHPSSPPAGRGTRRRGTPLTRRKKG